MQKISRNTCSRRLHAVPSDICCGGKCHMLQNCWLSLLGVMFFCSAGDAGVPTLQRVTTIQPSPTSKSLSKAGQSRKDGTMHLVSPPCSPCVPPGLPRIWRLVSTAVLLSRTCPVTWTASKWQKRQMTYTAIWWMMIRTYLHLGCSLEDLNDHWWPKVRSAPTLPRPRQARVSPS